ncbi:hypothetical protein G7072_00365 [Nocardioides sp. HDW12B]|uniref:hypothetical protein n=1 Tax=Nocardioides sp. HDW12B TaxID=2714939 RepID=UPI0014074188|nr:hypothetical protein [Nocardioides sp. HDW12B]QIK64992.1 hypothetical protein G7072_00365 [Nocardioides sp. HDW12B]
MTAREPLHPRQLAGGPGPDLHAAAEEMLLEGDAFAVSLAHATPPAERDYTVTTLMGRMRVRWDDSGELRAVASTPRAGMATRFRGRLSTEASGPVLRGTSHNRSHWFWRAVIAPIGVGFTLVAATSAVDGVWGVLALSLVVLALCVLGHHQLGRRASTVELQSAHLADLARTLWDREGFSPFGLDLDLDAAVPGPDGETPRVRPVTAAERELLDEVVLALREADAAACRRVVEEYDPMTPDELADLFATFITEELVPDEIVEAARDVRRRLGG